MKNITTKKKLKLSGIYFKHIISGDFEKENNINNI